MTELIIVFANGNKIQYLYTSDGTKQKKLVYTGATLTYTQLYSGHVVFRKNGTGSYATEYINMPDGRLTPTSAGFQYEYFLKDHLGNVYVSFTDVNNDGNAEILGTDHYYPFGLTLAGLSYNNSGYANLIKYNSKELQEDFNLGWYDYGARFYDPALGVWHTIDPKATQSYSWSPYVYVENNPLKYIDPNGERKWPVQENYNGQSPRVDSWFGPRNISYGSKNHNGLDINFGSGSFDYGAPVLATHDGKVVDIKESNDGYGRYIIIESPDGSFRTSYVHLKEVDVEIGQTIKEGDAIGEIGGSGKGKNLGYASHLHYVIKVKNSKTGKYEAYNPTEGNGNSNSNIVDPQTWISGNNQEQGASFDMNSYMNQNSTAVQDNTRVDNSAFIQQINNLQQGNYKVVDGKIVPQ